MFNRFMCWLLSACIIFSSIAPAYSASANASYRTAAETEIYLDEFIGLLKELRTHIDSSQFDLDALLSKLEFDSENIISFVKKEIRFEQYRGLLRGAQGTLMSRAGNALDQSVLLGKLLNDAGYEAHISGAILSVEQAEHLINQMFISQSTQPPLGDIEKINAVMVKLGRLSGMPDSSLSAVLNVQNGSESKQAPSRNLKASADAEFILRTLDKAGVALGNPEAIVDLVKEAQQYYWVEFRLGPSSPWIRVHPAFHDQNDELADLKVTSTLEGKVPDDLQHRFRFRSFIEQRTGNELKEYALMEAWERPVANMLAQSLSYANMPLALQSIEDYLNIRNVLATNNRFIPFFESSSAGPDSFDLAGRLIPIDAASSSYASVFETTAQAASQASVSLASMGRGENEVDEGDSSPFTLSAYWLEYTFIKPGGEETTYKRDLLDRIGMSARESGQPIVVKKMGKPELNAILTSFQSFMVAVGSYPDALILDRVISRLIGMRPTLSLVIQGKTDTPKSVDRSSKKPETLYPFDLAQLAFYTHVDRQSQAEDHFINYRGEPSLIVQSKRLSSDIKSVSSFDIVTNKRRVFKKTGQQVGVAPAQAVLAGVMETHAETFLRPKGTTRGRLVVNAVGVFEEAIDAGVPMIVLRPDSTDLLDAMAVSDTTRHHIQRDLKSGYILILPKKSPRANADYFAWWRINPSTGETLGIISNGLGGDFEEELALQKAMTILSGALGILGGAAGFAICAEQASRDYTAYQAGACCFADAVVAGGAAFFAGAVVGAYVGLLIGFVVMDMAGGMAMIVGGIMGALPTFCS